MITLFFVHVCLVRVFKIISLFILVYVVVLYLYSLSSSVTSFRLTSALVTPGFCLLIDAHLLFICHQCPQYIFHPVSFTHFQIVLLISFPLVLVSCLHCFGYFHLLLALLLKQHLFVFVPAL